MNSIADVTPNEIIGLTVSVCYIAGFVLGAACLPSVNGDRKFRFVYVSTIGSAAFSVLYPPYVMTAHYETFGMERDLHWAAAHLFSAIGVINLHLYVLRRKTKDHETTRSS